MGLYRFSEAQVRAVLAETGVPQERHEEAWASISRGYRRANRFKCWFTNLTAPLVMLFVLPFISWDAEELPRWLSWYNNDTNLNGDRFVWNPIPERVSLDPKDAFAIENCYWAPGWHPRSWWARYCWIGLRNRGKQSYIDSKALPGPQEPLYWGTKGLTRGSASEAPVTGWTVYCIGDEYQMVGCHPWKFGRYQETNWGWKVVLWRLLSLYHGKDSLMAVGINLKLRKPQGA